MKFEPMFCPVPNMLTWGAVRDNYTYIVSRDFENGGEIRASVKAKGMAPFKEGRHDLGVFNSLAEAEQACRDFKPQ